MPMCEQIAIKPKVTLMLMAQDKIFGRGTCQLLELIGTTGSIQEACAMMRLSYSKGSKLIKVAERQLGYPLVQRRIGGAGGGGSVLTEQGKRMVQAFRQLERDIQQYAERACRQCFEEWQDLR